jgi:hypothetical protein
MKILCIDPGIINLALVSLQYSSKSKHTILDEFHLVDITRLCPLRTINFKIKKTCPLKYHSKSISDQMDHVFHRYKNLFEDSDFIIIERQPPTGLVVIEQLIFKEYRSKSHLVSPNSLHKFFSWSSSYTVRKQESESYIRDNLFMSEDQKRELDVMDRRHDVTDAICFGLYWLSQAYGATT